MSRLLLAIAAFCLLLALSSCSLGYVASSAIEQSKIMLSRRPVAELIKSQELGLQNSEKLSLILEAREFASKNLGLNTGDSYKQIVLLKREALSWIVMGSKPLEFSLKTWWFPIVGAVPYKGFFELSQAIEEEKELKSQGFETSVRPTDAFSTLGWFADPVVSTMLKRSKEQLVDLIVHESFHATIWFQGHVDFNESLANFIGNKGAELFYLDQLSGCQTEGCKVAAQSSLAELTKSYLFDRDFAVFLEKLYADLDILYRSEASDQEKTVKRQEIFQFHADSFKLSHPELNFFKSLNNSELMQAKVYLSKLDIFDKAYKLCDNSLPAMIRLLKQVHREDFRESPFEKLREQNVC